MTGRRSQRAGALISGAAAGLAGFSAFLVVHAVWILPIWFIAPAGLVVAAGGGLAAGWAYDVHRARLPRAAVGRILAVFAAATLVLLPAERLSLTHRDLHFGDTAETALSTALAAAVLFLACAGILGAAGGALLGRSVRAAAVTALAALTFAIGIGHNAPFIGTGYAAVKLWSIMLSATAVASATLVLLEARLAPSRSEAVRGASSASPKAI